MTNQTVLSHHQQSDFVHHSHFFRFFFWQIPPNVVDEDKRKQNKLLTCPGSLLNCRLRLVSPLSLIFLLPLCSRSLFVAVVVLISVRVDSCKQFCYFEVYNGNTIFLQIQHLSGVPTPPHSPSYSLSHRTSKSYHCEPVTSGIWRVPP